MVGIAAGGPPHAAQETAGRRRASGIYGSIITAAILTSAGSELPTAALVVSVVVSLLVYWLAEEYAELLGEQVVGGRLPTWTHIRYSLAATWPMVSASLAPILVLLLARLAGASPTVAANIGLAVVTISLAVHGWLAARAAQLHGWRLVTLALAAVVLGLVMIGLKNLVLVRLH
jgi:hypothetical protein